MNEGKTMKWIVVALMLLTGCAAQPVNGEGALVVDIVRPAPLMKDQLYTRALTWMAESYRTSSKSIQLQDQAQGTIVANGVLDVPCFLGMSQPYGFKLRLDVKDNKYRLTFSQIVLHTKQFGEIPVEGANREMDEPRLRERFNRVADDLDAYLAKPDKDF